MSILHTMNFSNRILLIFIVVIFTSSPITSSILEVYDVHLEIYEMCDEEDSKEKVIYSHDEGIKDQRMYQGHIQFSTGPKELFKHFSPEVPFPPPKDSSRIEHL